MKKTMKKIITLAILTLLIIPIQAQNIGYQGRKTAFYYSAHITPNISDNESVDGSGININHAFEFDFSYNQSNSFGITYRLSPKRQYNIGTVLDYIDNTGKSYSLEYNDDVQPTFSPTTLGVFFKFRGYNRIAPLGYYQRLSLTYISTKVEYNPEDLKKVENIRSISGSGSGPQFGDDPWQNINGNSYSCLAIGYGIGTQRVLANRILLTYGIEVMVPVINQYSQSLFFTADIDEHFKKTANSIGGSTNFLSFHMGFGILGPRKKLR